MTMIKPSSVLGSVHYASYTHIAYQARLFLGIKFQSQATEEGESIRLLKSRLQRLHPQIFCHLKCFPKVLPHINEIIITIF